MFCSVLRQKHEHEPASSEVRKTQKVLMSDQNTGSDPTGRNRTSESGSEPMADTEMNSRDEAM